MSAFHPQAHSRLCGRYAIATLQNFIEKSKEYAVQHIIDTDNERLKTAITAFFNIKR